MKMRKMWRILDDRRNQVFVEDVANEELTKEQKKDLAREGYTVIRIYILR